MLASADCVGDESGDALVSSVALRVATSVSASMPSTSSDADSSVVDSETEGVGVALALAEADGDGDSDSLSDSFSNSALSIGVGTPVGSGATQSSGSVVCEDEAGASEAGCSLDVEADACGRLTNIEAVNAKIPKPTVVAR
ncbi:MAG TPA: hypothetical protein VIG24_06655 [Acidimicrobiia bacterium]